MTLLMASAAQAAERGAPNNVPEAGKYALVYSLDIPNSANYSGGVKYDIDLSAYYSSFSRVAYYLELRQGNGPLEYVWVSMDPFTSEITQIGIPTVQSGVTFQQPVANMNVASSEAGIVAGTNLTGGSLEFWPYNYSEANTAGVPNASDTAFDWGDNQGTDGNYGSMQIANGEASQIVLAFNRWGGNAGTADIGIGNNPAGNPDYTFAGTASSYSVKTLQVFVLPSSEKAPSLAAAAGQTGLTNVVLTFSKTLEDAATNISHYAINGGVTVLGATLDPATRLLVTLTTTPQKALTDYTVTVNGVRDRTAVHLQVAANSTAAFKSPIAGRGAAVNVAEASNYKLVYSLDIPDAPNYKTGVVYTEDHRADVTGFSRIAYYIELQQSGKPLNYLWASMDAFTNNVNAIGVPTVSSGAVFQQPVANLNVSSSVEGIVTGTSLPGGNLEFWPSNYESANDALVPNASDTDYDWGDRITSGNYGSMQLHNADASQVLFAFDNWGGNGDGGCVGIGNNPAGQPDWTFAANASSYTIKTLQVYVVPIYDTNRPSILSASGVAGLAKVVLAFSKPLDDSATNSGHYVIGGGLSVLAATLDPVGKAIVTLTTSPQQPTTSYKVTVNGLFERSGFKTPIAPNSTAAFTSSTLPGVFYNVPEAANYNLVYSLGIPDSANYSAGVKYDLDLARYFTEFSRIAYYLELQPVAGPLQYIWVSMDAFTADIAQIGVPTTPSGAVFQIPVANMTVASNDKGIVAGTGLAGGNLEFWPSNFDGANSGSVPNASDTAFDWGDNPGSGTGYGSMQIGNGEASQILFSFNNWGGNGGTADIGIGNNPVGNPDWTFAANANSYAIKSLQVFVMPSANMAPSIAGASGATGLTNVVLTFSKALEDAATNISHYAIGGGVSVLNASLDAATRLMVTLTTTLQKPLTTYTVTVNGVRDQTAAHLPVAANATATFRSSIAGRGAAANVAEAANYTLVYSLDIPDAPNYKAGILYNVDQSDAVSTFTRVAYYIELQQSGKPLNYMWASMDAFTNDVKRIGVPTVPSGAVFQQPVANLNVATSLEGVVTGTSLQGGNLEFWPSNYEALNSALVPNASDTDYDWGDRLTPGQHGSMQLHNADASQVLFGFNNWGGNGAVADLGIGTNPSGQPDWTFAGNASSYVVKTLQVYVLSNQKPFKITGQGFQSAGNFKVTCEAQSGTAYSLWRKLDLSTASWTKVAEATSASGTVSLVDTQATGKASFYQVRTP